jgi:hypothetical protein
MQTFYELISWLFYLITFILVLVPVVKVYDRQSQTYDWGEFKWIWIFFSIITLIIGNRFDNKAIEIKVDKKIEEITNDHRFVDFSKTKFGVNPFNVGTWATINGSSLDTKASLEAVDLKKGEWVGCYAKLIIPEKGMPFFRVRTSYYARNCWGNESKETAIEIYNYSSNNGINLNWSKKYNQLYIIFNVKEASVSPPKDACDAAFANIEYGALIIDEKKCN